QRAISCDACEASIAVWLCWHAPCPAFLGRWFGQLIPSIDLEPSLLIGPHAIICAFSGRRFFGVVDDDWRVLPPLAVAVSAGSSGPDGLLLVVRPGWAKQGPSCRRAAKLRKCPQCMRGTLRNFARSDEFTRTSKVTPSR